MRHLIVFFVALASLTTYALQGYWNGEEFIELSPETSNPHRFVIPSSPVRVQELNEKVAAPSIKSASATPAIKTNEGGYFIDRSQITKSDYVSDFYRSGQTSGIIVLPRLVVKIKEGYSLSSVLDGRSAMLQFDDAKNDNIYILNVTLKNSSDVLTLANQISGIESVEWCEVDLMGAIKKCNPLYSNQYYLKNTGQGGGTVGMDINVEEAWSQITNASTVVVAVVDDGIELEHEDLTHRISSYGYTCGLTNTLGEPVNESVDDVKGHGTACAGIIAADNNEVGVRGICENAHLLSVNIFPGTYPNTAASYTQIANAIEWAYPYASILSCSWGGDVPSPYVRNAINNAMKYGRNSKGCVVVASAGNSSGQVKFPANISGVISVGAIDRYGNLTSYSCHGDSLDLVAFGGYGDITTTDRNGAYGYSSGDYTNSFDGTSAACPQVAGVAAMMLSVNPELTRQEVRKILIGTARDLGTTGFDTTYGYGLVDAGKAVKAAKISANIEGKIELTTTNHYRINNVPEGYGVSWSLGTGNLYIVSVDADSCGCTVGCIYPNAPAYGSLNANLTFNGNIIRTYRRPIINKMYGSYWQDACTFNGVSHPAISHKSIVFNSAPYVHMGCKVHLQSYYFEGVPINLGGLTPSYYYFDGTRNIEFTLPYVSGVPFMIYVNGGQSDCERQITFFPQPYNGNVTSSINAVIQGNSVIVNLEHSEPYRVVEVDGDDNIIEAADICIEPEWSIEVYDYATATKRADAIVSGNSHELNIADWPNGVYIIKAHYGNEALSTKFIKE